MNAIKQQLNGRLGFLPLVARGARYVVVVSALLALFGLGVGGAYSLATVGEVRPTMLEPLLAFVGTGALLFSIYYLPSILMGGTETGSGSGGGTDSTDDGDDESHQNRVEDPFAIQADPYGTLTPGGIISPDNVGTDLDGLGTWHSSDD